MQVEPRILGAMAAALALGVTSGAVLGKVPQVRHTGLAEMFPTQASQQPFELQHAAPDHYALITRDGRFEVSQLSDRGLYRNFRYSPDFAVGAFDAYLDAAPAVYEEAAYEPVGEPAPAPDVIKIPPGEPARAAEPVSTVAVAEVAPRIIDVAAELAAR